MQLIPFASRVDKILIYVVIIGRQILLVKGYYDSPNSWLSETGGLKNLNREDAKDAKGFRQDQQDCQDCCLSAEAKARN